MFTLLISCLTTSNLPWFMDLTFQVPMQYCSLQHQTLLPWPVTSTTGCCFCFVSVSSFFLELFLHWSPVAYWAPTDLGVPLSVSYHSAFSYCSWGSQSNNTEVVCHSLLQWTTFCQTSPPWPVCLGGPHMTWLSLIELDQGVVLWSDWPVVCDRGFSLSALWCPFSVSTIFLGFLLPWTWGVYSWPLATPASCSQCKPNPVLFEHLSPETAPRTIAIMKTWQVAERHTSCLIWWRFNQGIIMKGGIWLTEFPKKLAQW